MDTITVEFPLDDVHEQIVDDLTETNIDVEALVQQKASAQVEQALYEAYMQAKYDGQRR